MAIGKTNAGAGGSGGVTFRVVNGLTQPTSPKENTIWVKTDIEIPNWTTASSNKAPAYVAPKGRVTFWWESATSGEVSGTTAAGFMPIKYKATNPPGNMRLKPINCYQNQDGTAAGWKSMDAYIYKGGTWVQCSSEEYKIFKDGEFYNDIEFVGTNKIVHDWDYSSNATAPTIAVTEGNMHIHLAQKVGASGAAITKNKIDITRLKTIKCDIKDAHTTGHNNEERPIAIGLYANNNLQLYKNAAALTTKITPITNESLAVDVSELSGEYYLAVYMQGYNNAVDVTISLIVGLEV